MKIILSLILLLITFKAQAQFYEYSIDLTSVKDDKMTVEVVLPNENGGTYYMPAMVPGTYSVYDFGRFISGVKAYDRSGTELTVTKNGVNGWNLPAGTYKLSYTADDTWDKKGDNPIFEPGGTNFESGKNFMLNTHTLFGYLKGYEKTACYLNVTKPADFYGATALKDIDNSDTQDRFEVQDYHRLVDSPLMYCKPDTAIIRYPETEILVSAYSPNNTITASFIAENLQDILDATRTHLGGQLPVDKYAFLFYFADKPGVSGGVGALEHSYSSLYYLPEINPSFIKQMIRDVTAHEFLHIKTPLTLHSEEIGDFDFNNPVMSKHLWLYEGSTEYHAHYIQMSQKKMSLEDYLDVMKGKIASSRKYKDDLPFTEMSKGALDKYKAQYTNVYQKGALISMCLDIWLRNYSDGNYSLQDLINDLSKKYGKDVSFKDDELFSEITAMTYPEIGEFFRRYVEGPESLPYKETFEMVGIDYNEITSSSNNEEKGIQESIGFNPATARLVINSDGLKKYGFEKGDEILSIDGEKLTQSNIQTVFMNAMGKETSEVIVVRGGSNETLNVTLNKMFMEMEKGTQGSGNIDVKVMPNPTEKQLRIRNAWTKS